MGKFLSLVTHFNIELNINFFESTFLILSLLPTSPEELQYIQFQCKKKLPRHIIQRNFILKELRKLDNILVGERGAVRFHRLIELDKILGRL